MSLQPLAAWWPEQPISYKKLWRSRKRSLRHAVKRQYYLTNALADGRSAFSKNEDIALTSLLVIGFLSFASLSVFANTAYTFTMAASVISAVSHLNLALLVLLALGVVGVLYAWIVT